jgi:Ca-activated chloride channel family protein
VTGTGQVDVEIFTSTEKGGSGKDGWLVEVAENFNRERMTIDGSTVSVSVRNIASGLGTDYIVSGNYSPDAFTPSNELWGWIIEANGIRIEKISDRLIGNVTGVLLSDSKYD